MRERPFFRRAAALAGVLILALPLAGAAANDAVPAASPSPAPSAAADQRAFLELTVNAVAAGTVPVVLRGEDVLVREDDLVRAGVIVTRLQPETIDGVAYVSLRGLAPGASFTADRNALTLVLTLPADFFAARNLDTEPAVLPVANASHSGFFNYAVGGGSGSPMRFNGELGITAALGLFDTMMRRDTVTGRFLFDQTNFTRDNVQAQRRTVLGETFVVADDFAGTGGAQTLVGATVTHDRSLGFAQVRSNGSQISGIATTPSVVEVYVNGALVRRVEVPPGPFQLANLPLRTGSNDATVVVRDAYGRATTIGQSIYTAADLLRSGERQYQFGAGKEINDYNLTDGRPLDVFGRYAYGINDHLTVGARAVVGQELDNVGFSLSTASRFGEVSAVVSASSAAPLQSRNIDVIDSAFGATPAPIAVVVPPNAKRVGGDAFGVAYNYAVGSFAAGASAVRQSPFYAALGRAALADRISGNVQAFVQMAVGARRSLTVSYENLSPRDQDPLRELNVALSSAISRFAVVTLNAGERRLGARVGPDIGLRIDANLSRAFGAHASNVSRDGHYQNTVDLEQGQIGRFGPDFDLQQTQSDIYKERSLNGEYLTPRGNVSVFVSQSDGSAPVSDVSFSGAIAAAGGSLFFAQPISGAFAVVDTGGLPGTHVLANGEDVGVADRRGRLLVPNLFAYGRNTIAIDNATLPADGVVDDPVVDVAPPYRGGTLIAFSAHRVRAYIGKVTVRIAAATVIPQYGQLRLTTASGVVTSDIGDDGAFYFDALHAGTYAATVRYAGVACEFRLTVPSATGTVTNVGTVVCEGHAK